MPNGKELEIAYEKQMREIRAWLKDKSVRSWKRSLYLLYRHGGQMGARDIALTVDGNISSVWRTLKKLELSGLVKSIKKNNKVTWIITDYGIREIRRIQKNGFMPKFEIK